MDGYFSGIEAATGPAHCAIRSGIVGDTRYTSVRRIANENPNVRSISVLAIIGQLAQQIDMRQIPSEFASQFKAIEDGIAGVKEVGSQLAVPFDHRSQPRASFMRLR